MASQAADSQRNSSDRKITDEERARIRDVMARAAEVEMQEKRRLDRLKQPIEGQLNKWTNPLKGWQPRWFYLDPTASVLYYYVSEDKKKGPPRGSIYLEGAVVSPSDDDSQTFGIHPTNGDTFKLRAVNAKERQSWVTKLRQVIENLKPNHKGANTTPAQQDAALPRPRKTTIKDRLMSIGKTSSRSDPTVGRKMTGESGRRSGGVGVRDSTSPLVGVGDVLELTESHHESLLHQLELIGKKDAALDPYSDPDILLMKATSEIALSTLHSCFKLLAVQAKQTASVDEIDHTSAVKSLIPGSKIEWIPASATESSPASINETTSTQNSDDTEEKSALEVDSLYEGTPSQLDIEGDKKKKSVVLQLLSQLKLGVDMTRVSSPVFILERRSLLEMVADFLSRPDVFRGLTDGATSEERMIRVTKYFLTSFSSGKINSGGRKPYNPILGEFFECMWDSPDGAVTFTAEQVSHNPPISALYSKCPSKRTQLNGHLWTKPKFLGMAVGVELDGEVCISLLEHDEDYIFTLPTIYVRSILTLPWVELGGLCKIVCKKSGYQTTVEFQTKPSYGGTANAVSGEIRYSTSESPLCRISGLWSDELTIAFEDDREPIVFNASATDSGRENKIVRPISVQGDYESRRLWRRVTLALKRGDFAKAEQAKEELEERQRQDEKSRVENVIEYKPKLFHKNGAGWLFNESLSVDNQKND
ncbi:oxysterol-binding protein-related protein 11-like [Oscarella lobularis]|uniref:oxysterol-binding protein-related protein 11-like n=1 Tax=Oscarella lobularis TaxID=121494 RepID=UPI00331354CF